MHIIAGPETQDSSGNANMANFSGNGCSAADPVTPKLAIWYYMDLLLRPLHIPKNAQ